jgi:hypothetical protein
MDTREEAFVILLTEGLRHDDGVLDLALEIRVAMDIDDRAIDDRGHFEPFLACVEHLGLHNLYTVCINIQVYRSRRRSRERTRPDSSRCTL